MKSIVEAYDENKDKDILLLGSSVKMPLYSKQKFENKLVILCANKATEEVIYRENGLKEELEFKPDISILENGGCSFGASQIFLTGTDNYKAKNDAENTYFFKKSNIFDDGVISLSEKANWKSALRAVIPGRIDKECTSHVACLGGLISGLSIASWLRPKSISIAGFCDKDQKQERYSCFSLAHKKGQQHASLVKAQLKYVFLMKEVLKTVNVPLICEDENSKLSLV
jgi:hypothetical protein